MADYGTSIPKDQAVRVGLLDRLIEAERAHQMHDAYLIAVFALAALLGLAMLYLRHARQRNRPSDQ